MRDGGAPAPTGKVSLATLAWTYLKITLSSFGGGLSAWVRYMIVERHRWMDDTQFLSGLALARTLPGPNQVNMALYVGYHLRGLPGSAAALAGLLVVPLAIIVAFGTAYLEYHEVPALNAVLHGAVAAAAGMSLSTAVKLFGDYWRKPDAILFMAATFVAVGLFRWPLELVVLILAPIAVVWFWPREDKPEGPK
ncbi:MAG: chromate transporter [Pseudomonadota bacterium]